MPLYLFINSLCESDVKYLIIEGDVPHETLIAAWDNIYIEFLDGMTDKSGSYKLKLSSRINKLKFDVQLIELCILRLNISFNPEILEILKGCVQVTGEFHVENQDGYFKNLQAIRNRLGRMRHEIIEKEAELKLITKGDSGSGAPTKQQFDSIIAQVSRHSKFHINKREVTVSEFTAYHTAMREENEALRKQLNTK